MPDKYYMIGFNSTRGGLFALYTSVLSYIIYAVNNNYIPVIDFKNFDNQFFKENKKNIDNSWEYFFKQPANIRLEDIPENADCIYENRNAYICPKNVRGGKKG